MHSYYSVFRCINAYNVAASCLCLVKEIEKDTLVDHLVSLVLHRAPLELNEAVRERDG